MAQELSPSLVSRVDAILADDQDDAWKIADEVFVFPGDGPVPDNQGATDYFAEDFGLTLRWHSLDSQAIRDRLKFY